MSQTSHKDFSKRLEIAANVAILSLCLLSIAVIGWRFLLPRPARINQNKIPVGEALRLEGIDWTAHNRTIVLALSTQCRYCSESSSFYQKLVEFCREKEVRVIAVFPQSQSEGLQYFKAHQIPIQEVVQSPLPAIHVNGTPTLFFVDRKGVITAGWIGKLSPELEQEVIGKL